MSSHPEKTFTVVITHWVHGDVVDFLERFAIVHRPEKPGQVWSLDQLVDVMAEADALITCMADCIHERFLGCAPRLKIIAATLKGYDNYDVEACNRHGVLLSIVLDSIIGPTAEHAVALTLALLRNIRQGDEVIRSESFQGWRPHLYGGSLHGATVGIIGMGQLGAAVAKLVDSFGIAELLFTDLNQNRDSSITSTASSRQVQLDTLLSESNIIIVTLPLTKETFHLLDGTQLESIKPGTYLINVGRGSVLSEEAVLGALNEKRLAGYAADVFEMEDWALPSRPNSISTALAKHPQTVFTPHLGSAVDHVRKEMSLTSAAQVRDALVDGKKPKYVVN